jgi:hypothetical protein
VSVFSGDVGEWIFGNYAWMMLCENNQSSLSESEGSWLSLFHVKRGFFDWDHFKNWLG